MIFKINLSTSLRKLNTYLSNWLTFKQKIYNFNKTFTTSMYKLHVSPRLKWVLLAQSSNVLFLQPSLSLGRGQPQCWMEEWSVHEWDVVTRIVWDLVKPGCRVRQFYTPTNGSHPQPLPMRFEPAIWWGLNPTQTNWSTPHG